MTPLTIENWLVQVNDWHQKRKHDQVQKLEQLLLATPKAVWSSPTHSLSQQALPLWLDACLRLYLQYRETAPLRAYSFIQLAYGRLQQLASRSGATLEMRNWAIQRTQHLVVLSLEFCQQQTQDQWRQESQQLIESHVRFMQQQAWNEIRNDDQGDELRH